MGMFINVDKSALVSDDINQYHFTFCNIHNMCPFDMQDKLVIFFHSGSAFNFLLALLVLLAQ